MQRLPQFLCIAFGLIFLLWILSYEKARLVVHDEAGTVVHERRNARGDLHGLQQYFRGDWLVREAYCEHGVQLWAKDYWPSGAMKQHVYEAPDYRVITDVYRPDGSLLYRSGGPID